MQKRNSVRLRLVMVHLKTQDGCMCHATAAHYYSNTVVFIVTKYLD